jgi:hypothetical protein
MIKGKRKRWTEHVARMGEVRNAYSILVETTERKRALGRSSLGRMIILERMLRKKWECVDGTHLVEDRDQ